MIYFIQAESGPIKIGYTNGETVEQRLSAIQTSNHEKLICLGFEEGSLSSEKRLHEQFAYAHKRGEWFYSVKDLIQYINDIEYRSKARKRLAVLDVDFNEVLLEGALSAN